MTMYTSTRYLDCGCAIYRSGNISRCPTHDIDIIDHSYENTKEYMDHFIGKEDYDNYDEGYDV